MRRARVRRHLPPLGALVAFEAAARHGSFTRGAAELCVTQSAISHRVRVLENDLGVRLFHRRPRQLVLTEAGERVLEAVGDALDRLDDLAARLRGGDDGGTLTVSVLPSFARSWLVPRLGTFRAAHPDIDVRLETTSALTDFARDDVDVAIRFGGGRYPGLRCDRLMTDEVFPVCSPALLRKGPRLTKPGDLRQHTLLHAETRDEWRDWLRAARVRGVDATRGPMFTDSSLVIAAAVAGQGVALGRRVLAATELAAGRLVRPFGHGVATAFAYYLVCPTASAERPKVRAFRAWLIAEAAHAVRAARPTPTRRRRRAAASRSKRATRA